MGTNSSGLLGALRGKVVTVTGSGTILGNRAVICRLSTDKFEVLGRTERTCGQVLCLSCTCQVANSAGCDSTTRGIVGAIYSFGS